MRCGNAQSYSLFDKVKTNARSLLSSFRDASQGGAGPESILPIVIMDSGLALRAPRNDNVEMARHCERSEAIQEQKGSLDCSVAFGSSQ